MSNNLKLAAFGALVTCWVSLGACAANEAEPVAATETDSAAATRAKATQEAPMVSLATYVPVKDAMGNIISASARLTGTLQKISDCAVVQLDNRQVALVFPEKLAALSPDSQSIMYKDTKLMMGQTVDLSGGYMSADEIAAISNPPLGCTGLSHWKVG